MNRNFEMKELIPVVKLGEPLTYRPWDYLPLQSITIRMHDLLNSNGKNFKKIFYEINNAGGIHSFLDFNGTIILSTIMSDKKIHGCSTEKYKEVINSLKPDFFMTLDGETYELNFSKYDEEKISALEQERIIQESDEVIKDCKESIPLGLIKGANTEQIKYHIKELKKREIIDLVFHTGDFIWGGTAIGIRKAQNYASHIRKSGANLICYGLGSEKNFQRFSFANAFITQSHYISAFNGYQLIDGKLMKRNEKPRREIIMKNLKEINKLIPKIQTGGIFEWVEDTAEKEQAMLNKDMEIKPLITKR